jgi:hypothetical protein
MLGLGKFGDLLKSFLKRLGYVWLLTDILCESYTGSP